MLWVNIPLIKLSKKNYLCMRTCVIGNFSIKEFRERERGVTFESIVMLSR
jgi:hypothetical protein